MAVAPVRATSPGVLCCGGGGGSEVRLPSSFDSPTAESNWAGVGLPVVDMLNASVTFVLPPVSDFPTICGGSPWSENALLTDYQMLGWVGMGGGTYGTITWPFWQAGYALTFSPTSEGAQPTNCNEVGVTLSLWYEGWKDIANAEPIQTFTAQYTSVTNWDLYYAGTSLTVTVATDGAGTWTAYFNASSSYSSYQYKETDSFLQGVTTMPDGAGFMFEPPWTYETNGQQSGYGWAPLPPTYAVSTFASGFAAYTLDGNIIPASWLTWYINPQDNGYGNQNSALPVTSSMNGQLGEEND